MPQLDVLHSNDVTLEFEPLFQSIENTLNELDPSAKMCKSRAYPAPHFLHTHVLVKIGLLKKPHRDQAFMENCLQTLKQAIEPYIPEGCYYAIDLSFSEPYYLTLKK